MRTLASVVSILLFGAGVAVVVIWVQESNKQRAREAEFAAHRAERTRLASCVADKASDTALREILIAQHQPQGVLFKQSQNRWAGYCAELAQKIATSDDRKRVGFQLQQRISCISDPEELSGGREAMPDSSRLADLLSPLLKACDVRPPRGYVMPDYMSYYTFVSMDLMDQARFRAIYEALMEEDKAIMQPLKRLRLSVSQSETRNVASGSLRSRSATKCGPRLHELAQAAGPHAITLFSLV